MEILNSVLPVFLVIALGYVLRSVGFLRDETTAALSKLVFYVAAPALLFRSAATTPLDRSLNGSLLLVLVGVTTVVGLLFYLAAARCAPSRRGVLASGAHRANMVFVGLPIVANAYGEEVIGSVVATIGVMVMVYNVLAVLLLTLPHRDRSARSARIWLGLAARIARNPLIIGIAAGIAASLLRVRFPAAIDQSLELVGRTALPVALVAVQLSVIGSYRPPVSSSPQ